ncbi:L-lysine 2,3-aminomutase [Desulfobotulus alkaliphilus]|uniref:L-lysine 2,3-aminomutase n=1 Tax=Desulfobotulus alkaliphilus TaxID=622671 RepID=A0A562S1Z9_9BACT|nr:KamA family radical SAM protein [Desulfobotulus alkaliphilus]TWI75347.1 L-lysine 2,3-aminomutase [Desulfobotulus alkaliphilus]
MTSFSHTDWKTILRNSAETPEEIASALNLDAEALESVTSRYPARINPYYMDLIKKHGLPLFLQAVPRKEELEDLPWLLPDGLCEEIQSPVPGLFHRYPDRVILAVSSECALFCRHCMRKRDLGKKNIFDKKAALAYLEKHPEIKDVILSGGDPLMLSDAGLDDLLSALRRIPHVETLRIHTRMPCTLPYRITPELVKMLRSHAPLFVNTHFNHPSEITEESIKACGLLVDAGIPVGCQSVLLKGVNDDKNILTSLFRKLMSIRVRPYYLHHPDPVAGILPFRMDVQKGLEIYRSIRGHVSGMAVPPYMIDLPGGGGKVGLHPDIFCAMDGNGWIRVASFEGKIYDYPALARPTGPPLSR